MEYILRSFQKAGIFGWLYIASLAHGFHFFAVHYIHSSYLQQYVDQAGVGLIIALSSGLTVLVLSVASVVLRLLGNYNTAIFAAGMNFAVTIGLALATDLGLIFVLFALHTMLITVTLFTLDVFLENSMEDEGQTGGVRGIFLSMALLAALLSPFVSGFLVDNGAHYEYAYIASALYLLPVLAILALRFRDFRDPVYHVLSYRRMFSAMWENRDLFHVSMAQFLMRFFFSWYVVYLPIYLHQEIGFSWTEIGLILFLMLIPYIMIEYPAGKIADKYLGEQELMVTGFFIAGISTIALFFVDTPNLMLWAGVLMATRVGCALIESMTETYFFRQIDGDDTSILSIFRMLRPLGYTVGPFVAGILLMTTGIQSLWLVLGVIMLLGMYHPFRLHDTK